MTLEIVQTFYRWFKIPKRTSFARKQDYFRTQYLIIPTCVDYNQYQIKNILKNRTNSI